MANVFRKAVVIIFVIMLAFVPLCAQVKKPEIVKLKFETFLKFPGSEEKVLDLASLPENFLVLSRKQYPFSPESYGVLIYDEKRDEWRSCDYLKGNKDAGKLIGIYKNGEDIWISTLNVSFYYNRITKKLTEFPFTFYSIAFDGDVAWVGTTNKLLKFDKKLWALKTVDEINIEMLMGRTQFAGHIVSAFVEGEFVYYAFFTRLLQDFGPYSYLKRVNRTTNAVEVVYEDAESNWNDIQDCFASSGTIWCFIDKKRILEINGDEHKFVDEFNAQESNMRDVIQSGQDHAAFKQLYFLNKDIGKWMNDSPLQLPLPLQSGGQISGNSVCDSSYCWIGWEPWLSRLNLKEKTYLKVPVINFDFSMKGFFVKGMDDDYLVLSGESNMVMLYSRRNKHWRLYVDIPAEVVKFSSNSIWFAGYEKLCQFRKYTQQWVCYKNNLFPAQVVVYRDILYQTWQTPAESGLGNPEKDYKTNILWDMQIDSDQNVWISDRAGNLFEFNSKKQVWRKVAGIGARNMVLDGNHLWIGTKSGISLYDLKVKKIKKFVFSGNKAITKGCSWIAKQGDWIWCSPWFENYDYYVGEGLKRFNVKTHRWVIYVIRKDFDAMFHEPVVTNNFAFLPMQRYVWKPATVDLVKYYKDVILQHGPFKGSPFLRLKGYRMWIKYEDEQALLIFDARNGSFKKIGDLKNWVIPHVGDNYFYLEGCEYFDSVCKNFIAKTMKSYLKRIHKNKAITQYVELPENDSMFFHGHSVFIKQGDYLLKARLE